MSKVRRINCRTFAIVLMAIVSGTVILSCTSSNEGDKWKYYATTDEGRHYYRAVGLVNASSFPYLTDASDTLVQIREKVIHEPRDYSEFFMKIDCGKMKYQRAETMHQSSQGSKIVTAHITPAFHDIPWARIGPEPQMKALYEIACEQEKVGTKDE